MPFTDQDLADLYRALPDILRAQADAPKSAAIGAGQAAAPMPEQTGHTWFDWLNDKAMDVAAGPGAKSLPLMADYSDIPKSAGIGLARSGIDFLGAPGDIRKTAGRAANWLGIPEPVQNAVYRAVAMNPWLSALAINPGSQGVQQMVEQFTGPFYQPQSVVGRVWETNARRAGNLALGGAVVKGMQLGDRAQNLVRALMK